MKLLVSRAQSHDLTVFNSGGQSIELGELATVIAGKTGVGTDRTELESNLPADNYFPKDTTFEDLLESSKIQTLSLDALLDETIKGHLAQITGLQV